MDSDVDSFVLIRGDHQPAVVREHLAQARMFDLSAGTTTPFAFTCRRATCGSVQG